MSSYTVKLQDTVTVTVKIDKTSPVIYASTDKTTDKEILQTATATNTDGTYTIILIVTDNVGNTAYDEMTLIWDTTFPDAPTITLLDPVNNANKDAITITGTGDTNTIFDYLIIDNNSNNIT